MIFNLIVPCLTTGLEAKLHACLLLHIYNYIGQISLSNPPEMSSRVGLTTGLVATEVREESYLEWNILSDHWAMKRKFRERKLRRKEGQKFC